MIWSWGEWAWIVSTQGISSLSPAGPVQRFAKFPCVCGILLAVEKLLNYSTWVLTSSQSWPHVIKRSEGRVLIAQHGDENFRDSWRQVVFQ